jgi:hypothetical protein
MLATMALCIHRLTMAHTNNQPTSDPLVPQTGG